MSSAKKRKNRPRIPREDAEPPPQLPPRPEYLQIAPGQVIWRNSIQPDPEQPFRQVTWDVRFLENRITIHADLAHEGEMRELDFREVRSKLDEILNSKEMAVDSVGWHMERIRQSVFWQRIPEPSGDHLDPPYYDGTIGSWSFALLQSKESANLRQWVGHPVLRRASNEMYLMRQDERQWVSYARKNSEWAGFLSLDEDLCGCFGPAVCRMRLLHYWQIPECRQLFLTSENFTILFCGVGLLSELEDINDGEWKETVTRLARLSRRELMGHIGLPPTDEVVQLFSRIKSSEIVPHWPLIQQVFNNPLAVERLSETTCGIDVMMLRICPLEDFPLHWPLFRQLCREGKNSNFALRSINYSIDFFSDDPISQRILKSYLSARSVEEIQSTNRVANWLRRDWRDLFQPGVQDALDKLSPPLPETESIRLLNRPLDLIAIGNTHDLCLGKHLRSIIEGKYALYKILHQEEFALVGIQREGNEPWQIDQIKGKENTEPSEAIKGLIGQWAMNFTETPG
ncbi:MAG: hypothetical protein ACK56K_00420 [Akkermansiaceae bacterium]|jgi:hypothetical protein|nr:hypothetical protein [Luteolibacter sp.]